MNSSNSAEKEPRKGKLVSRRTVLIGGAASVGAFASNQLLHPISRFENWINPHDNLSSAETQQKLQEILFKKLSGRIEGLSTEEERQEGTTIAQELQKIISVNDRFVNAYRRDIYIDGERTEPRLASLYRRKYASFQIEDPESMIWIVNNNMLAESLIVNPLKDLVEVKMDTNVLNSLLEIKKKVDEDKTNEGEQKFSWGSHIRLKDYGQVDTQKGGTLQIGAGSEIRTEEGRRELVKDIENVKNILANTPRVGDVDVRLWSERYGKENKYRGRGIGSFGEGTFLSEVDLGDAVTAFIVYHEVAGHGLDIVHNDTQLFRYLSPEAIYKLTALREEALSDKNWGRTYPDIEHTFEKRIAIIPPKVPPDLSNVRILPPNFRQEEGPVKVSSFRESSDDYPDGIFCTGLYIDTPISGEANIQRKVDQGTLKEYQGIFELQGTTSWTLQEFLDKPDNLALFKVMTQKSPWLGAVIGKLRNMVPTLDGRLSWLEIKNVLSIPKAGSKDSEWYGFLTGIGQRLAVAEMFRTRDSALNVLAESEKDHFQGQLLGAHYAADLEMFANMMAVSLNYSSLDFESPSPYLTYIETIREDLLARGISVEPTRELMATIARNSPVSL